MNRISGKVAFTLVEVVIALGVAAFTLTAILGLLSFAMNSSRNSMDDTLTSAMSLSAVRDLRGRNFSSLPGTADVLFGTVPDAMQFDLFFDGGGFPLNRITEPLSPKDALDRGALYRCTVTMQADPESLGSRNPQGMQAVGLLNIELKFSWPAPTTSNSRIVHASIARYY